MKVTLNGVVVVQPTAEQLNTEVGRLLDLMKVHEPELNSKDALLSVARENPDLFRAISQLYHPEDFLKKVHVENGRLVADPVAPLPKQLPEHIQAANELHILTLSGEYSTKVTLSDIGLLDAEVERLIKLKQRDQPELSYKDALLAVAREAPDIFRARTQLFHRGGAVAVHLENGRLVADLVDPLPERVLEHIQAAKELHVMTEKRMKSDGPKLSYGEAFKLVAAEHPTLTRRARNMPV